MNSKILVQSFEMISFLNFTMFVLHTKSIFRSTWFSDLRAKLAILVINVEWDQHFDNQQDWQSLIITDCLNFNINQIKINDFKS